jgi:hypothetical protein
MNIVFENIPHSSYISAVNFNDIPAYIQVDNTINVLFQNVFEKNYTAYIDKKFIDDLVRLPIVNVGGIYPIKGNILLDICLDKDGEYNIINMKYFTNSTGWYYIVKEGLFQEPEREPDPDWL